MQMLQLLQLPGKFICNDFRSLLEAGRDGIGTAQLPQPLAMNALRQGRLKTVGPEHAPEGWQLFIHYPTRKQLPARVRVFVDFCIGHLAGYADPSADVAGFAA